MTRSEPSKRGTPPAVRRLCAIADLDDEALSVIERAAQRPTTLPARRELVIEGQKTPTPLLLLEGWAARARTFADGRRQIIGFVLPGDIIGNCDYDEFLASSATVALTDLWLCQLEWGGLPKLKRAFAISRALDEAYLMAQVVRLGRLDAAERITDLMLELDERLSLAGLSSDGRFEFPLTQEVFADAVGLTSVHVNRMVQQARKRGELVWADRTVRLADVEGSRQLLGRSVTKVV